MTESGSMPTPGRYFVRYLLMGLSGLLLAMIVGRVIFSEQLQKAFITASILVTNLSTVWLYTTVILKDKRLRSDPDAPDMAYYLGFSLTVGALALTFIVDIGTFKGAAVGLAGAQGRGQLVENALGQFGAGLLATLFGLCAKIYLGSQQSLDYSDPDSLYQQFRSEISNLRRTLETAGTDLAASVQQSCEDIKRSGETANLAMIKLADDLTEFQSRVAQELSSERISPSIRNFVTELERISTPVSTLTSDMTGLANVINKGQTTFNNLETKADEFTKILESQLDLRLAHEESLKRIIESNDKYAEQQSSIATESKQTTSSLRSFGRALEKFANELPKLEDPLSQIAQYASPIAKNFEELSRALSEAKSEMDSLIHALQNEVHAVNTLTDAAQQLSETSSAGGMATRSLHTSIEALVENVRNAESTISRLTSALHSDEVQALNLGAQLQDLAHKLSDLSNVTQTALQLISTSTAAVTELGSSINGATSALNSTPTAIEDFIRPLTSSNAALHQLNTSIGNLNSQISASTQTFQRAASSGQG